MIHQRYKDMLFLIIRYATWPNYYYHRAMASWHLRKSQSLNLGSGENYFTGFINIDANILRKPDIWLDLRNGIPFPKASVKSIYCSQLLEHLYPNEADFVVKECYRVLCAGGAVRMVVPNLKNALHAYMSGDSEFFIDDPNYYENWSSFGGRFSNFIFCDGQHQSAFDYEYMYEILSKNGFTKIIEQPPYKSFIFDYELLSRHETRDALSLPRFLYVEAFR